MQLLPQHFQLQSLRAEGVAANHAAAGQPYYWGVLDLDIDESALIGGLVRISALEAILPDGLLVNHDPALGGALELNVVEAIAAAPNRTVTVYLAVPPLYRAGRLDPVASRYVSAVGEATPDLASGEGAASLTVWRPALRLVVDSGKADLVCVPLLRVGQQGGGFTRQPYVAPCPRALPESVLGRKVANLCAKVREKCVFLSGRLRQAKQAGNEDDIEEINRQLTALWARLPEVEAALGTRSVHPSALYLTLAGMAGALSALDPGAGVPVFRAFDYLDLLASFDDVIQWLSISLDRVRAGYHTYPFGRDSTGFWLDLPALDLTEYCDGNGRLVVGLRMPNGAGEQAAAEWLSRAIIASEPHIATLVRQRMRGMPYQAMDRAEQVSYSVGEETRLFVLTAQGEWFDAAQRLRIAMPNGGASAEPWEVVLFVQDSEAGIPVLSDGAVEAGRG